MTEESPKGIKMAELADLTGVPPRTIRLYIARGLLMGPLRLGRGAVYGEEHVERLNRIRQLQDKGLTLAEILHALTGEETGDRLPSPQPRWHYSVAEDVAVSVRADTSPWRLRHIRKALARLAAELAKPQEEDQNDERDG